MGNDRDAPAEGGSDSGANDYNYSGRGGEVDGANAGGVHGASPGEINIWPQRPATRTNAGEFDRANPDKDVANCGDSNAELHDERGLIGHGDLVFDAARLVVELDGWAYHTDPDRFQRDRARQNRIVAAGWRVLRFTWRDLTERPAAVVAAIRAELDRSKRASGSGARRN